MEQLFSANNKKNQLEKDYVYNVISVCEQIVYQQADSTNWAIFKENTDPADWIHITPVIKYIHLWLLKDSKLLNPARKKCFFSILSIILPCYFNKLTLKMVAPDYHYHIPSDENYFKIGEVNGDVLKYVSLFTTLFMANESLRNLFNSHHAPKISALFVILFFNAIGYDFVNEKGQDITTFLSADFTGKSLAVKPGIKQQVNLIWKEVCSHFILFLFIPFLLTQLINHCIYIYI